jgi:hypothetical protein
MLCAKAQVGQAVRDHRLGTVRTPRTVPGPRARAGMQFATQHNLHYSEINFDAWTISDARLTLRWFHSIASSQSAGSATRFAHVLTSPHPHGLARLGKSVMIVVNIRPSSRWLSAVTAMPMEK